MQVDAMSLTVAGLALTLIGIIATVIAPFLVRGARVHYEVTGTSELPRGGPIGNLDVQIFHAGKAIQGYLYSIKAIIRNSGRKDVVSDNFVDPIALSLNGPYDLLHADAEAKHGVGEAISLDGESAKLDWRILKPKEDIDINLIIRSDRPVSRRKLQNITSASIRLKDVESGKPFGHGLGIARFIAVFSVISALSIGYFIYTSYHPRSSIVTEVNGQTFRLRSTDLGYSICDVRDKKFYLSRCSDATNEKVVEFAKKSEVRSVYSGIRASSFFQILIVLVSYSALFASLPQFYKATRSLAGRLSGKR